MCYDKLHLVSYELTLTYLYNILVLLLIRTSVSLDLLMYIDSKVNLFIHFIITCYDGIIIVLG